MNLLLMAFFDAVSYRMKTQQKQGTKHNNYH